MHTLKVYVSVTQYFKSDQNRVDKMRLKQIRLDSIECDSISILFIQFKLTEDSMVDPYCLFQTLTNLVYLITTIHAWFEIIDQDMTLLQLLDRSGALSWSIISNQACIMVIEDTRFVNV